MARQGGFSPYELDEPAKDFLRGVSAEMLQSMLLEHGDELVSVVSKDAGKAIREAQAELRSSKPKLSIAIQVLTPDVIDAMTLGMGKIGKLDKMLSKSPHIAELAKTAGKVFAGGKKRRAATRGLISSAATQRGETGNVDAVEALLSGGLSAGMTGILGKVLDQQNFRDITAGLNKTSLFKSRWKKTGRRDEASKVLSKYLKDIGAFGDDVVKFDAKKGHFIDSKGAFPSSGVGKMEVDSDTLNKRIVMAREATGEEIGDIVGKYGKEPTLKGIDTESGDIGMVSRREVEKRLMDRKPRLAKFSDSAKYKKIKDDILGSLYKNPNYDPKEKMAVLDKLQKDAGATKAQRSKAIDRMKEEISAIKKRVGGLQKGAISDIDSELAKLKLEKRRIGATDVENKLPGINSRIKELEASRVEFKESPEKVFKSEFDRMERAEKGIEFKKEVPAYEQALSEDITKRMDSYDPSQYSEVSLEDIWNSSKDIGAFVDWGKRAAKDADPIPEQTFKGVRQVYSDILNERMEDLGETGFKPARDAYSKLSDLAKTTADSASLKGIPEEAGRYFDRFDMAQNRLHLPAPLKGIEDRVRAFTSQNIDKPMKESPVTREYIRSIAPNISNMISDKVRGENLYTPRVEKAWEGTESKDIPASLEGAEGADPSIQEIWDSTTMNTQKGLPMERNMASIQNQMQNLPLLLNKKQYGRNIEEISSNPKLFQAKLAQMEGSPEYINFQEIVGIAPDELVGSAVESEDMETINRMLPQLTEFMPSVFQFDKYKRINSVVPVPMRAMAQKDLMNDNNLSNSEKIAKISEMNRTGKLA